MSGFIPTNVDPNLRRALQDLWRAIDAMAQGDMNLGGRRVRNIGKGVLGADAVTLNQLKDELKTNPDVAKLIQQTVQVISVGPHNLLSATHPDTTAAAPVAEDLLVGLATGQWGRFPVGGPGNILGVGSFPQILTWLSQVMGWTDNGVTTTLNNHNLTLSFGNGFAIQIAPSTELLTVNATSKDTTSNLLIPNSIILCVSARVVTTITGTISNPTSFAVGDPTTANRFASGINPAVGTVTPGIDHWSGAVTTLAAGPTQGANAKVRITLTGAAGTIAGVVRLSALLATVIPPTS